MEFAGISAFDIAVLAAVLLGALFGLVTGFVRGGLFVASWIGAGLVTIYGYHEVSPLVRDYIQPNWLADIIGGAVLFIAALIVLHLLSHILSGWVRSSRLNALDRSLGLLAGVATAALVVAVGYLVLSDMWGERPPEWVETARTRPVVETGALLVRDVLPARVVGKTGAALEEAQRRALDADAARRTFERLSSPPDSAAPAPPEGYKDSERQQLDKLIQESR